MRKTITYPAFALVCLTCIVVVLMTTPGPEFLFQNAKGDCSGRSIFMYNVLYADSAGADVVFFGSSKTMNGVNDSLLTARNKGRYLNLGYCRFGRNLDHFFIETYCRKHHPKQLVLEVREEENNNEHPLTAFLMPVQEIAAGATTLNSGLFVNLYNKFLCNLKYLRKKLFKQQIDAPATVDTRRGFWYGNKKTYPLPLVKKRFNDSVQFVAEHPEAKPLNRNSEYYFEKIKTLCTQNHIALYFLYLPDYGNRYELPLQQSDYRRYGRLLIPPDSLLKDLRYFSDYGHLNKQGADQLSLWLNTQLSPER